MSASKLTDRISLENIREAVDLFPYGKWQLAGMATGSFLAYKLAGLLKLWLINPQFSPQKDLPGPDSYENILLGDFRRIIEAPPSSVYSGWFAKYGHTLSYRSVFLVSSACLQPKCCTILTISQFRAVVSAPRILKQSLTSSIMHMTSPSHLTSALFSRGCLEKARLSSFLRAIPC